MAKMEKIPLNAFERVSRDIEYAKKVEMAIKIALEEGGINSLIALFVEINRRLCDLERKIGSPNLI